MDFKKQLKRGALVGAGFLAGVVVEASSRRVVGRIEDRDDDDTLGDVWEGRTYKWKYPMSTVDQCLDVLDYEIGKGWWVNHPTYIDDLRSLRLKFSHGMSNAQKSGRDVVEVELSDRERLVLYHTSPFMAKASSNAPIREDFLEKSRD